MNARRPVLSDSQALANNCVERKVSRASESEAQPSLVCRVLLASKKKSLRVSTRRLRRTDGGVILWLLAGHEDVAECETLFLFLK